jgi:predicted  nucleic acid-binding Zn-ribbon protein
MYECYECGEEFNDPIIDAEGEETCPSCGSDDIVEVDEYDDEEYSEAETVDELMDELDDEADLPDEPPTII